MEKKSTIAKIKEYSNQMLSGPGSDQGGNPTSFPDVPVQGQFSIAYW